LEQIMQTWLRKSLVITALALGATQLAHAQQSDVARWQSVIGIIQGGNVVGTGTGAVTGAPGPWSAQGGHVTVDLTHGKIQFDVRGLVFAAGNSIGNTGTVAQVQGTLVCDTNGSASPNSIHVDTPLVDLDEEGDAHFSGNVTIPAVCATEPDMAFLIRLASGKWIGNGTVLR
jgi:polyisoprenoid-binding protein YceI